MQTPVFISWSGERSLAVAEALRDWLPEVLQYVDVKLSSRDISAGSRWQADVASMLAEAEFGVLVLTPENLMEPWILFEAGALSKTVGASKVVPYLLDTDVRALSGPLVQFQAVSADDEGTLSLVRSINQDAEDRALDGGRLNRSFDRNWDFLEGQLLAATRIQTPQESSPPRPDPDEVQVEMLTLLRQLAQKGESSPSKGTRGLPPELLGEPPKRLYPLLPKSSIESAMREADGDTTKAAMALGVPKLILEANIAYREKESPI